MTNLTVEDATKKLQEAGFVVAEQQEERNSEDVEKGKVIETDPEKDAKRVKGTEIELIVSLGVETVKIDDYTGQQISQVEALLKDKLIIQKNYVHSKLPEGQIIEQDPQEGAEIIAKDATITFTISQGVKMITVDSVANYTKAQMDDYVKRVGLKWRTVREEYSDTVAAGSVISQTPKPGTSLMEGDTIAVVLSKGPAEKPVKTLIKNVLIPYEPTEEGAEQVIRIEIQDKNHTMVKAFDEFTITSDQQYKIQLVIVEGEEAAYKIIRDSEIIESDSFNYDDVK